MSETIYSTIPQADYCFMGGSSTFSLRIPEDLNLPDVTVIERKMIFQTPYGDSPIMKLFQIGNGPAAKKVLTTKMHGRRLGVSRTDASRQIFWVLKQAGVKKIVAEGGVGAVNHLMEMRDLLVPSDYLDLSLRKDVELGGPHLLVMRDPICPSLRDHLLQVAEEMVVERGDRRRIFHRGIYAVSDGRHWESRAEIQMVKQLGADVAGQSMCPEVYLSREIGACFAGLYMVVNYAEGIVEDWKHKDLKDIFYGEAEFIGKAVIEALRRLDGSCTCGCQELKKPSLLIDKEYAED